MTTKNEKPPPYILSHANAGANWDIAQNDRHVSADTLMFGYCLSYAGQKEMRSDVHKNQNHRRLIPVL